MRAAVRRNSPRAVPAPVESPDAETPVRYVGRLVSGAEIPDRYAQHRVDPTRETLATETHVKSRNS